jgi:hypothetical protein
MEDCLYPSRDRSSPVDCTNIATFLSTQGGKIRGYLIIRTAIVNMLTLAILVPEHILAAEICQSSNLLRSRNLRIRFMAKQLSSLLQQHI